MASIHILYVCIHIYPHNVYMYLYVYMYIFSFLMLLTAVGDPP